MLLVLRCSCLISLLPLLPLLGLLLLLPPPASPLASPPPLPASTLLSFARAGHCKLPSLLPASSIPALRSAAEAHMRPRLLDALQQKLAAQAGKPLSAVSRDPRFSTPALCEAQLAKQGLPVPFLQHFNCHLSCEPLSLLARSRALAGRAAQLLGVRSVRLCQDSLFLKRGGDGETPYHSDLRMAPFDTNSMVTLWVPLTPIPPASRGGTGLLFVPASHVDVALPFFANRSAGGAADFLSADLAGRYAAPVSHAPLGLGDATAHHGWTLHRAGANAGPDRLAYAVSYVDARATVRRGFRREVEGRQGRGDMEDEAGWGGWVRTVKEGRRIPADHPVVPVIKL